eukprot:gene21292-25585_t
MSRPEHTAPAEVFYNDTEAKKYTASTRMMEIQETLTKRALELLALPQDGSPKDHWMVSARMISYDFPASAEVSLNQASCRTEEGHHWIGMDISPSMLEVAQEIEAEGDLLLADMGQGVPMRPAMFDGAISISAVQESMQQAEMITMAAMRAGFSGGLDTAMRVSLG